MFFKPAPPRAWPAPPRRAASETLADGVGAYRPASAMRSALSRSRASDGFQAGAPQTPPLAASVYNRAAFGPTPAEILVRRMGNPNVDLVFPGYSGYAPLGVVQGVDLPVGQIFRNGFESGIGAWTASG